MNVFEKLFYNLNDLWNDLNCYSTEEQMKKLDSNPNEVSEVSSVVNSKEELDEIFDAKRLMGKGSKLNSDISVNYVAGFQIDDEQLNEIFEVKKLIKRKR